MQTFWLQVLFVVVVVAWLGTVVHLALRLRPIAWPGVVLLVLLIVVPPVGLAAYWIRYALASRSRAATT